MTLYSRYLLSNYFKVLSLTLGTFIAFLLIYQLEEVAQFAAFGVPLSKLCIFILLQIPFLLPLALPIACLLASLLLMQRLSVTNELTALRASGYSLPHIMLPLLTAGAFLSLAAFYINSELATSAHRKTREMIVEVTAINPLVMLQHSSVGQLKGAFVQMDPISQGRDVANLVIALPSRRLVLGLCDRLSIVDGELQGMQTTWLTTMPNEEGFDHLILENLSCTHSPAVELMTLLRTKGWRLAHDHLCWKLLTARERELGKLSTPKAAQQLKQCKSQKALRFSLGLMPLTFTLMGGTFGIGIERGKKRKGVVYVAILTLISLVAIFGGKELGQHLVLSLSLLFTPHILIGMLSVITLQRLQGGRG